MKMACCWGLREVERKWKEGQKDSKSQRWLLTKKA